MICVIFLFCGIFADWLAPYGYNQISPINRLKPPSEKFWLGTDNLGRDVWSRIVHGSRISLVVGLASTLLGAIVGGLVGLVSGYMGGKVDLVAQRLMAAIDDEARKEGKTVLVLDTMTGGDAERLYERAGWQRVGVVPKYALMPTGEFCATTFFFKHL